MSSEEQTAGGPALRKKRRLLCVDDDKDTIELLRVMFGFDGYYVKTADTASLAMAKLENSRFDLYLLDNRLPDMNGVDLIRKIRAVDSNTPIVLASGEAREEEKERALMAGAQTYVTKPWDPDFLLTAVKNLISEMDLRAIDARLAETAAILQQIEDHRDTATQTLRAHRLRSAARQAFLTAGGTYAGFHRHFPGSLAAAANHQPNRKS